jgi:hypothetical protein
MFLCDDLAWNELELGAELAAPGAVLEGLALPRSPLYGRDVFPSLVVARAVAMMHGIEDAKLRLPCGVQDLQHIGNAIICFGNRLDAGPELAVLGDEVVYGSTTNSAVTPLS